MMSTFESLGSNFRNNRFVLNRSLITGHLCANVSRKPLVGTDVRWPSFHRKSRALFRQESSKTTPDDSRPRSKQPLKGAQRLDCRATCQREGENKELARVAYMIGDTPILSSAFALQYLIGENNSVTSPIHFWRRRRFVWRHDDVTIRRMRISEDASTQDRVKCRTFTHTDVASRLYDVISVLCNVMATSSSGDAPLETLWPIWTSTRASIRNSKRP